MNNPIHWLRTAGHSTCCLSFALPDHHKYQHPQCDQLIWYRCNMFCSDITISLFISSRTHVTSDLSQALKSLTDNTEIKCEFIMDILIATVNLETYEDGSSLQPITAIPKSPQWGFFFVIL